MTIEIVFFDAGGTLLDPHPSFAALFASSCQAMGYDVTDEQVNVVQDRLAPHLTELVEEADLPHAPSLSEEASYAFWTFTYRRFLGELGIDDEAMTAKLYETFSSTNSYRLYEDVRPALDSIEVAGYRIGLISNFDSWLEKMLIEMEVGHIFDPSVISGMVGVEKPDPEIYRIAVQRAGVEPTRAVHVGDSPRMDIEPSALVGITPILIDRAGRYPAPEYPRIESLEGLLPLVSKL